MNKKVKIIIVVVIVLIILFFAVVALGIGGAIGFAQYQCMQDSVVDEQSFNVSRSADSVNSIDIALPPIRDSWVHVYGHNDPDIIRFVYKRIASRSNVIDNFDQDISTSGGVLTADFKYNGDIQSIFEVFLGCPKYDVSVYVPQDFEFEKVSINSLNANYEIKNCMSKQVSMKTTAGRLIASNIISDTLQMDTNKGHIDIDSTQISGKITGSTNAGIMTVIDTKAGELEFTNTGAGKISLTSVTSGMLTARIIKGDIITDRCTMTSPTGLFKTKTEGGETAIDRFGEGSINAASLIGNIKAEFSNSFSGTFEISSANGELRVDPLFNATYTEDTSTFKKGSINGGGERTIIATSNRGDISLKSRGA